MKTGFPLSHGLSAKLATSSLFGRDREAPTLTDIQYESLVSGVARGVSLLVVAPTSSGKTNVGLAALASWLEAGDLMPRKAVYLTSHRALARQKFNEFVPFFKAAAGLKDLEMVVATGDGTLDATGQVPSDLNEATLIVATYEKYLGLLAGGGIQEDLSHVCFVCDELQVINDRHRGEAIEILLTMLRRARYGQIVGLSAVIAASDAKILGEWLGATLVSTSNREVPIRYELRTVDQTLVVSTDRPEDVQTRPRNPNLSTIEILQELVRNSSDEATPIAVFCMRRRDVFDLSKAWARLVGVPEGGPEEIPPDFGEMTASAEDLACYVPFRFAFHTADLVEAERAYVETRLDKNELAVVFSTTTLAMGLNYSFKTVIFDRWRRYNFARRQDEPIARAEFHNIAGRAGRLSLAEEGRVIFATNDSRWERVAAQYLNLTQFEPYEPRLNPENFEHIALQLVSSGIARTRDELLSFLQGTLSAKAALDVDAKQQDVWATHVDRALSRLTEWGFIR